MLASMKYVSRCNAHIRSELTGRYWVDSMWNNVVNAWWPLVLYKASDAPRFRTGMIAMLGTCAGTLAATAGVWAMERRERERGSETTEKDGRLDED